MNFLIKNRTLIVENQYFGCIEYYLSLYKYSNIKIEQCESWQKMSFRNRCVILGANGLINLTIPLENGRDQKCLLRDVKINNQDEWQKQHWRSIFSSYGKSPFFEFYSDWLEIFYQKKFIYLFDLNLEILFWLKQSLKISGNIELTDTFENSYPDNFSDCRNEWLPKNFQSNTFHVKYSQVFEGKWKFQNNLF